MRTNGWALCLVFVAGCGGGSTLHDAGNDASALADAGNDAASDVDGGTDAATIADGGSDAGNDAGTDAGPSCPCFAESDLVFIEGIGGARTCVVDASSGGTTQTALIESVSEERVVAETPISSTGDAFCGFGCLSSTMGGTCGRAATYQAMHGITAEQFAVCHDLIAGHCH